MMTTEKQLEIKRASVGTESIDRAPCLMCPVEHMCTPDSSYSPTTCNLIEDWLLTSFDNNTPNKKNQEPER